MNYKFHPYGYTLSNNPKIAVPSLGVKIRRKLNPFILKMASKYNNLPLELVFDGRCGKNEAKIYIASHAFPEDVLNSSLAINEPCYILAGNKEVFFGSIEGLATWIYGGIVFDRINTDSRKSAALKMERVLNLGSSVLLFPEGAWNMSDNQLIGDLHGGFYDLAMKTGCDVSFIVTYKTNNNTCAAYVSEEINVRKLDIDTLRMVYKYINKCISKCCDFPIEKYSNYDLLREILLYAKETIFTLTADFSDVFNIENNLVVIGNYMEEVINRIDKLKDTFDEVNIIKRIKVYLKAIINARKIVVTNVIRDKMATEKVLLMEKYGVVRHRIDGKDLSEIVAIEKDELIHQVSYYNYDEEKKALFIDPLKKDMEEEFVKVKRM